MELTFEDYKKHGTQETKVIFETLTNDQRAMQKFKGIIQGIAAVLQRGDSVDIEIEHSVYKISKETLEKISVESQDLQDHYITDEDNPGRRITFILK